MSPQTLAWAEETWKVLQPHAGGRMYANYMSVEGEPAVRAAFGSSYSRLASIKKKYDPTISCGEIRTFSRQSFRNCAVEYPILLLCLIAAVPRRSLSAIQ